MEKEVHTGERKPRVSPRGHSRLPLSSLPQALPLPLPSVFFLQMAGAGGGGKAAPADAKPD